MHAADQAVFVLEILLALGPLAVYFLGLGLISSQARPWLISARADFSLLAVAFVPLLAAPVVSLVEHGQIQLATAIVIGVVAMFFMLLPARGAGWVIYNCSPSQCRRLVRQACRQLHWPTEIQDTDAVLVPSVNLTARQHALWWLRSVTLQIESPATPAGQDARGRLIEALRGELDGEAMLPSTTGVSLVLIGTALLGLPLWYLFHHLPAIVEIVRRIVST